MKIRIHPLFLFLVIASIFTHHFSLVITTLACVLIHELSHYLLASSYGYELNYIMLMPYGAMLKGDEKMLDKEAFKIALIGPFVNMLIAFIFMGLWWFFPSFYPYTENLVFVNISICLFNLLPAFPLDGSMALIAIIKNKKRVIFYVKIFGIIISIGIFAIFIVSIFHSINYTYLAISIFLFWGNIFEAKKLKYVYIAEKLYSHKKIKNGGELKQIIISESATVKRAIRHLEKDRIVEFIVVNKNLKTIKTLKEEDILLLHSETYLNKPLGFAISTLYGNSSFNSHELKKI